LERAVKPEIETDWPYDADRDDPLTAMRIPVVGTSHPRWNYIVAFDLNGIDDPEFVHRPDEAEAAMLRSFLDEYIEHWYNERWIKKMLERPFDIDGGANGTIFRKYGASDWGYRKRTWEYGPLFFPQHPRIRAREENQEWRLGPLSLEQVMDRIYTYGDDEPVGRWVEWKAAHPGVFGGAQ
jgi:hypothetical protein